MQEELEDIFDRNRPGCVVVDFSVVADTPDQATQFSLADGVTLSQVSLDLGIFRRLIGVDRIEGMLSLGGEERVNSSAHLVNLLE